ncbi:Uncharacterised protein [Mycobacteroides abscessus subsp. massiliense]|nr:Uncharacterised protein [Mycobacteroides abscessus subsp. massiliense]
MPQCDAFGQILRHHLEGLHGEADGALGVADPLDEVVDRRLDHQCHAGALRGLQVGEERQPVFHDVHGLGGQASGVLLDPV